MMLGLRLGIDVLLEEKEALIKGRRIGLVSNALATDASGQAVYERLLPWLKHGCIFTPEHGLRGAAAAGEKVGSGRDRELGLPLHSLYGKVKKPTPEMLSGLDVLVYDLPCLGARFFTYIATLGLVLEAAAESGLPLVVLDRPVILNAETVEGGLPRQGFTSFVCPYPLPVRYGLSNGELARFILAKGSVAGELEVVAMKGYRRDAYGDEWALSWTNPSPNLRSLDACLLYAGSCFIEGTTLSEGRGTERPFRLVGSPGTDAVALARRLGEIPGLKVKEARFKPRSSKHEGKDCRGVELCVSERKALAPTRMGLHLLEGCRQAAEDFAWLPAWKKGDHPPIDLLTGGRRAREHFDGGGDAEELWREWEKEAAAFAEERREFLIY